MAARELQLRRVLALIRFIISIIALSLLATHFDGFSAILAVPDNYPSITAAIGLAGDGDTILVRPGVYQENVRIEQKTIFLTSEFSADSNLSTVQATVIDGSNPSNPQKGSAVTLSTIAAAGSRVVGFTITGGVGTFLGDRYTGGGVLVFNCPDVKIAYNIISGNAATYGGGLSAYYCSPRIEHNIISANSASFAGGVDIQNSQTVVTRNIIYANDATDIGGGIRVSMSESAILSDNVLAMNSATAGGGIACVNCSPQIAYNCFWQNAGGDFDGCDPALGDTTCCINYNRIPSDSYSNIFRNPVFGDPAMLDFSLACESPAIDAGSRINPNRPIAGQRTDIGMIEYEYLSGDFNAVEQIDIDDAVALIEYLYSGGDPACPLLRGDFNCDGKINSLDVTLTTSYIFRGGFGPCSQ